MKHFNVIDYSMKSVMDASIRKAIQHSGYSDIELGHKLNVSRSTIFKWRTIENYKIRSSNIIALAKALDKEPKFEKGYVSFVNKQINIDKENDITMDFKTDDLINDLRNDKKDLRTLLEEKDKTIKEQISVIKSLNKKLDTCIYDVTINLPQIDHHELQVITTEQSQNYHSVSTAYAKFLGYSPIEMLHEDFTWLDAIHPDDHWKLKNPFDFKYYKVAKKNGTEDYITYEHKKIGHFYFSTIEVVSKDVYDKELNDKMSD